MKALILKRFTPKAVMIGLGLLSILAITQPSYASSYFSFGFSAGSPAGWRWSPRYRAHDWCYWHPGRCGYYRHRYWHRRWERRHYHDYRRSHHGWGQW